MLAKGHLSFRLDGQRLRGAWTLIRMRKRAAKDKHANWLLIKGRDDFAAPGQGAPVSTPLAWDEISARLKSDRFHIGDIVARPVRVWEGFFTIRQSVTAQTLARLDSRG